ncbi:MAG: O-antigen ligase family protein [Patescibacteria group bacterium]
MKQAARWTAIIALFTIPFLPLYVANDLFFPFITGKNFAFRILVEVAFCAWALLALLDRRYRPKFSWTLVLFGGFVAWMLVADLLGVNPGKALWSNFERMDGWVMLIHVFGLFVVAGSVLSVEKLWRRWWLFFLSVGAVVCVHGLMQVTGSAEIHQGSMRVTASFGNAIYMAVYLMFSILIAAWLSVTSKGWLRYALAASALASLFILLFTASRGPVIGLAAGVAFGSALWLALALRTKEGRMSSGVRWAAGLLAALAILVGGFFLIRDSAFVENTPVLQRLSSVFTLSEELEVRGTIWGMALEGVKEDPLTGFGQEGFNQIFNAYYEPSLFAQEAWFDRAHNAYVDWLVAGGIPALLLFLSLLAAASLALLRAPGYSRAERAILIGALAAYAVQALVVFDNLFSYVPLVIILAMAHAESARNVRKLEALPELKSETGMAVGTAAAVVLAIALIYMVNVPGIRAANNLVYALSLSPQDPQNGLTLYREALAADAPFGRQEIREQLVSFATRASGEESIPVPLRSEIVLLAIEEMGKEVAASPNDARLRLQYASAFDAAGDLESSLAQIEEALLLSPRKQAIYINKGFKLHELGRSEEARTVFLDAYELDPSFPQLAVTVAAGYIVTGDAPGGKALLVEALGTTTPDNETLFYAYYQAKLWDELIAVAQARVTSENGSAQSRLRLAQAYAAAGRAEQARAEILGTIAAHPEARAEAEALLGRMFVPAQ